MGHNLNDNIIEFLNQIATDHDFKQFKISDNSNENKCEGFASVIVSVNITDDCKILELIVKMGPKNGDLRKMIPFEKVFHREAFIYNTVLTHFELLESKYQQVPIENEPSEEQTSNCDILFGNYPKCYKTFLKYLDEVIIIENLSISKKFSVWNKCLVMNHSHLELVFSKYASLHALSFASRHFNPEIFEVLANKTRDVYMDIIKKCGTADIIRNLVKKVVGYLEIVGEKLIVDKLNEEHFDIIEVMEELVQWGEAGEHAVICHGDNWSNNILFQYKDKNDPPSDVKFIDWQLARYGSPVLDLSYFLYTCGGKKSFEKLDELLELYHKNFTQKLKNFKLNSHQMYPLEKLKEDWKKFAKFGLGMSFLVIHVAIKAAEETPKIEQTEQSLDDFLKTFENGSVNDDEYMRRMLDVLQHFVQNNLL